MNDSTHSVWFVSEHYGKYMMYNKEWGDKIAFSEFCTLDNRQRTEEKVKEFLVSNTHSKIVTIW